MNRATILLLLTTFFAVSAQTTDYLLLSFSRTVHLPPIPSLKNNPCDVHVKENYQFEFVEGGYNKVVLTIPRSDLYIFDVSLLKNLQVRSENATILEVTPAADFNQGVYTISVKFLYLVAPKHISFSATYDLEGILWVDALQIPPTNSLHFTMRFSKLIKHLHYEVIIPESWKLEQKDVSVVEGNQALQYQNSSLIVFEKADIPAFTPFSAVVSFPLRIESCSDTRSIAVSMFLWIFGILAVCCCCGVSFIVCVACLLRKRRK